MPYTLQINQGSAIPKYRQIVNSILTGIERKAIGINERLPSINEISVQYEVSRDTVEKAYKQLKRQGIILSVPGKGYFTSENSLQSKRKVLLVFNTLSTYKKLIFEGFVQATQGEAQIDFQVYHEDFELFEKILREKAKSYTDFVIIPSFKGGEEVKAKRLINQLIPSEKLWILNSFLEGISGTFGAVYQDYEIDIFTALNKANYLLQKYNKMNLIFPTYSNYSRGIVRGFQKFCLEHRIPSNIIFKDFEKYELEKGAAYVVVLDKDLVTLVKKIKQSNWNPGKDVGILAYNDSPLKDVLLDGITVMSTKHKDMGSHLGKLVLANQKEFLTEKFELIVRNSL